MTDGHKSSVQGFVLAGGQSRRMGSDKAFLTVQGKTFLERVAGALSQVTDSLSVVGATTTDDSLGFSSIQDVVPNWGALGGVHAALSSCTADWALIVACDFPFVTRELFEHLLAIRDSYEAVAPLQEDLIPQPLCTSYRVIPCLERSNELIKSGERKPIALLQSVSTRWVSFDEVAGLTGSSHFFDNINSREDYARITREGVDLSTT